MINKFSLFALIAASAFVSCSENEQTAEPVQTYNKVIIDTVSTKKTGPDSSFIKSLLQRSASAGSLTGLPQNNSQTGSNVVKLNPAHGQPGHQCEIAVGAPLNSKAIPINTTPIQAITTATPPLPATTAQPITQKALAGINPAHGQPNHRCDIAVGAPLNSKPVSNNATPAIVNTASPSPVITTPPVQKVAKGMNPAHGQPGHRCEIAVGAPLNSKPTTPAASPVQPAPAIIADSTKK
jgi:hypothetical protein